MTALTIVGFFGRWEKSKWNEPHFVYQNVGVSVQRQNNRTPPPKSRLKKSKTYLGQGKSPTSLFFVLIKLYETLSDNIDNDQNKVLSIFNFDLFQCRDYVYTDKIVSFQITTVIIWLWPLSKPPSNGKQTNKQFIIIKKTDKYLLMPLFMPYERQ